MELWKWRLAETKKSGRRPEMSFGLIRYVLPGFISLRRGSLPRWVRLAAPLACQGEKKSGAAGKCRLD